MLLGQNSKSLNLNLEANFALGSDQAIYITDHVLDFLLRAIRGKLRTKAKKQKQMKKLVRNRSLSITWEGREIMVVLRSNLPVPLRLSNILLTSLN